MERTTLTPHTLYETYYSRLYQRAYTLLGHHEQAQDATHDAFFKAFRALEHMPLPDNPSPWLYRIVTNTALDVLRRRRRLSWHSLDDTLLSLPSDMTCDPQAWYPTHEVVHRVLADLPDGFQRALVLQTQGYSLTEIAHVLAHSPSGIKVYLSRARHAFRVAYLKEVGHDDVAA